MALKTVNEDQQQNASGRKVSKFSSNLDALCSKKDEPSESAGGKADANEASLDKGEESLLKLELMSESPHPQTQNTSGKKVSKFYSNLDMMETKDDVSLGCADDVTAEADEISLENAEESSLRLDLTGDESLHLEMSMEGDDLETESGKEESQDAAKESMCDELTNGDQEEKVKADIETKSDEQDSRNSEGETYETVSEDMNETNQQTSSCDGQDSHNEISNVGDEKECVDQGKESKEDHENNMQSETSSVLQVKPPPATDESYPVSSNCPEGADAKKQPLDGPCKFEEKADEGQDSMKESKVVIEEKDAIMEERAVEESVKKSDTTKMDADSVCTKDAPKDEEEKEEEIFADASCAAKDASKDEEEKEENFSDATCAAKDAPKDEEGKEKEIFADTTCAAKDAPKDEEGKEKEIFADTTCAAKDAPKDEEGKEKEIFADTTCAAKDAPKDEEEKEKEIFADTTCAAKDAPEDEEKRDIFVDTTCAAKDSPKDEEEVMESCADDAPKNEKVGETMSVESTCDEDALKGEEEMDEKKTSNGTTGVKTDGEPEKKSESEVSGHPVKEISEAGEAMATEMCEDKTKSTAASGTRESDTENTDNEMDIGEEESQEENTDNNTEMEIQEEETDKDNTDNDVAMESTEMDGEQLEKDLLQSSESEEVKKPEDN